MIVNRYQLLWIPKVQFLISLAIFIFCDISDPLFLTSLTSNFYRDYFYLQVSVSDRAWWWQKAIGYFCLTQILMFEAIADCESNMRSW